ncbi:MAG: 8-amino-7-oxononanoate synthase [Byssovorax sp.]
MSRLDPLRHLEGELAALDDRGLLRTPPVPPRAGAALLNLCSNDYLGYASDPWPEGLVGESGAGASRLVSGNTSAHETAEAALSAWLGTEAALLFSSGYAANVGTIAALAGRGDVIVSDALNHASLIDGCRLSGAEVRVVPHLDLAATEAALAHTRNARRRWVVTESYFSMDGDSPDLVRLRAICDAHDAGLVLDEAHVLGVFGPHGRGLAAESGVAPDVLIGTAGKALGLHGAFVAGSSALRLWLWNRARSFVFSTGVSPVLAAALTHRIGRLVADDTARARLAARGAQLRAGLAALGAPGVSTGRGPVLPWVLGGSEATLARSRRLREHGILVQAIRPPTVPSGTSRLRVTVHARLTDDDVERALAAFHATEY